MNFQVFNGIEINPKRIMIKLFVINVLKKIKPRMRLIILQLFVVVIESFA